MDSPRGAELLRIWRIKWAKTMRYPCDGDEEKGAVILINSEYYNHWRLPVSQRSRSASFKFFFRSRFGCGAGAARSSSLALD